MPLTRTQITRFALITAALSLGCFPAAQAENWVEVFADEEVYLAINQDSITRNGAMVEFWAGKESQWGEWDVYTIVNCQSRQFRETKILDEDQGNFESNTDWLSPKDTSDNAMVNYVCKP